MVALAIEQQVAFVLIAGDVYDGDWKDYNTGLFFLHQMSRLRDAEIDVYVIRGNHDAKSQITKALHLPANVHEFGTRHPETKIIEDCQVAIHGQSFSTQAVSDDLSAAYPKALPGCFNIGMLHTSATGREGHENYAPCSLPGLLTKGYDYWALGHVHQREVLHTDPFIVFPGNTQGRHVRETGSKGCTVVDVSDGAVVSVVHHELGVMQWKVCDVDATDTPTAGDLLAKVCQAVSTSVEAIDSDRLVALRIVVTGACDAHYSVVQDPLQFENEVRGALTDMELDRFWLEKLNVRTRPPIDFNETGVRNDAINDLVRFIRRAKDDQGILAEMMNDFQDLKLKLPAEMHSAPDPLPFDSPDLIAEMLSDVEGDLIGRLFAREAQQ